MAEEVKKEEPKKVGPLGKLKELTEDKEEQMEIFSTFVRLGILIWSGGILTLNYVAIPNFPQKNIDPTFIASVFTGVLASFGIQTAKIRKVQLRNKHHRYQRQIWKNSLRRQLTLHLHKPFRIEQAPMVIAFLQLQLRRDNGKERGEVV